MSGRRGKYTKHSSKSEAFSAKFTSDMLPEIKGIKKQNNLAEDDLDKELDSLTLPEASGESIEDLTQRLLVAKLANIEARTKSISEKTTSIKRQLFTEWTESFMSAFEDSFAIFKNALINLHLDAEKNNELQKELDVGLHKLEKALKKMVKTAKIEEDE